MNWCSKAPMRQRRYALRRTKGWKGATLPSRSAHPSISVVIPARNESHYLRPTVEQFQDTLPPGSEIIVVDNGSTDGSSEFLLGAGAGARLLRTQPLGVAGARNWGAWHSSGEIIVF